MTADEPSINRVAAAFVAAPAAATGAMAVGLVALELSDGGSAAGALSAAILVGFYGLFIAMASTIIFGIPVYALLRRRVARRLVGSVVAGVLIGLAPWVLVNIGFMWSSQTVRLDGNAMGLTALQAFSGAVGGFVFWWLADGPRSRRDRAGD